MLCVCGKNLKNRRSLAYHKRNCQFIRNRDELKINVDINEIEINKIKSELQPISLFEFINNIVFEQKDFEYYSLITMDNVILNTINIFKRALQLLEPNTQPIINFNEEKYQYVIHSFIDNVWKIDTQVSILKEISKTTNNDPNYKKDTFLYFLNHFHKRRIHYYKTNCDEKKSITMNLSMMSTANMQDDLITLIMKLVCYDK